jgi:hypothetical protein
MVAQSVPQNPTLEGTIALSSTVKVFGTVKVSICCWPRPKPVKSGSRMSGCKLVIVETDMICQSPRSLECSTKRSLTCQR